MQTQLLAYMHGCWRNSDNIGCVAILYLCLHGVGQHGGLDILPSMVHVTT